MNLKTCVFEILDAEARNMKGEKDGRKWDFWSQTVIVRKGHLAFEAEFNLPDAMGGKGYQPGFYIPGSDNIVQRAIAGGNGRARIVVQFESSGALVPVADAVAELQGLLKSASASPALRAAS